MASSWARVRRVFFGTRLAISSPSYSRRASLTPWFGVGAMLGAGYHSAFGRFPDRTLFYALEGWERRRGLGPGGHGPAGMSAAGIERKRSASGQAAAKAKRTRLAVSMTRRN